MGISGLLKHLRSITKRVHIREYHGLKAAIDIHCWIHKGSIGCCRELSEGIETSKFVDYCIEMLKLLVAHGIKPIVVFDGRALPAKITTNTSRRKARHENTEKAREAEADGRFSEAHSYYQKTTTVTPSMVHRVIRSLKEHKFEYMVAPYEADAQLAFLSLSGAVDLIITEDSDALVYGCRRVLYKLDKDGSGDEIKRRSLGANQGLSFLNWTDDQFKLMCCIAGCDYAKKIRNIGIVTAHKFVNKYRTFSKTTDALMQSKYEGVDEQYVVQLRRALNTFKHQTVFNAELMQLQPLTPIRNSLTLNYDARFGRKNEEDADCEYLGSLLGQEDIVLGVVTGALHPNTLTPFDPKLPTDLIQDEQSIFAESIKGQDEELRSGDIALLTKSESKKDCSARSIVDASYVWRGRPEVALGTHLKNSSLAPLRYGSTLAAHVVQSSSQPCKRVGEDVYGIDSEANDNDNDNMWTFSFKSSRATTDVARNVHMIAGESRDGHNGARSSQSNNMSSHPSWSSLHVENRHLQVSHEHVQKRPRRSHADSVTEVCTSFVPLPLDMLHRKGQAHERQLTSVCTADKDPCNATGSSSFFRLRPDDFDGHKQCKDSSGLFDDMSNSSPFHSDCLDTCERRVSVGSPGALHGGEDDRQRAADTHVPPLADLDCDSQNGIIRHRPSFSFARRRAATERPNERDFTLSRFGDGPVSLSSLRQSQEFMFPSLPEVAEPIGHVRVPASSTCVASHCASPLRDETYWDAVLGPPPNSYRSHRGVPQYS